MRSLLGTRILVTGPAGFIGANLVRALLSHGARVHGIVRPTTRLHALRDLLPHLVLHHVDLADLARLQQAVREARPELIFHLAVERRDRTLADRTATLSSNVLGTLHLLESLTAVDYRRLVHVGGSLEYGPHSHPLTESTQTTPTTLYGAARAAATLLCQQHARAHRRPITMLRLFSVYGPWEPDHRLVPTAIRAALRGAPLPLTQPGFRRDLVFAADAVRALLLATERDAASGEIINIGTGTQWTNEALVACLAQVMGKTIDVRVGGHPPRATDTTHWVADTEKARGVLGFVAGYSLHRGLAATIPWVIEQDERRLALARGNA